MKMELVDLCKAKANEKKAIEYSRAVRKREIRKNVLYTICAILIFFAIGIVGNNDLEILAAQGKITTTVESTEYYVICDVNATETNSDGETEMQVVMQDGSIQSYIVTDAPEENVIEVCFKTVDLDNFSLYKVVALR